MTAPPFYAFGSPAAAKYWPKPVRQPRAPLLPVVARKPSKSKLAPQVKLERRNARELAALQPVHRIIACLCEWFGRSDDEILGITRGREIFRIRAIGYYIAKTDFGLGNIKVGRVFGKDQSTIRTAVKKLREDVAGDAEIMVDVEGVRAILREADDGKQD